MVGFAATFEVDFVVAFAVGFAAVLAFVALPVGFPVDDDTPSVAPELLADVARKPCETASVSTPCVVVSAGVVTFCVLELTVAEYVALGLPLDTVPDP